MIAALHPVNGFAILLVGIAMAREAWLARNVSQPAEITTTEPATSTAAR
jgi:hypothetical protein